MESVCLSNSESSDNYISAECSCIPCHFLSFEQNEFETFFNAQMIMTVLKCHFSKQRFWWHQLDLQKSQFYNSWSRWAMFSNVVNERLLIWNWLMENLITQVLVKMLLFVTNKVFCEIIVWLLVDLHILHTVTAWQATESTKMHMKILLSKTHVVLSWRY